MIHFSDLNKTCLTLSWRRPISYRNQSINLLPKSMDWFLNDIGLRHERVNMRILVNKKFPMLSLHWWSDCQKDAGDKFFRRMKQKKAVSREIRSFQFGVQALFKRENTPGIFFNYKKNIGGSFHVARCIYYPSNIYLFKVETLAQGAKYVYWRNSSVFIVNNEHILHLFLVFLLLSLSK